MRSALWPLACLLAVIGPAEAGDSLFGRKAGPAQAEPTAPAEQAAPAEQPKADEPKPADEPAKDGKDKSKGDGKRRDGGGHGQGQGRRDKQRDGEKSKDEPAPAEDVGVIIRPVKLDEGIAPKERLDFQLSRIDRPLARETTAAFREAWTAFRSQNRLSDSGDFVRSPQAPAPLKAKLLQDLGDGRWFVDAEWSNAGQFSWCQAGANADKAVLVLGPAEAKVGDAVSLHAVHAGLVELRFDCAVEPAAGRRITIRRHAFLAAQPLPDDEATRARFQQAVAAGKPAVEAVVVQVRDCKACGGVGYIRRPVPGKIQDAHDPCPEACERGRQRVPVLVTFKP